MSEIDVLSAEEAAIVSPGAPPAAPEPAPAPQPAPQPEPAPTPKAEEPPKPAPEAPKTESETPKGGPNDAIAAMRRENAEMRRQLAALQQQLQPKQPEIQPPAFDQDPATNLNARLTPTEQAVAEIRQQMQAQAVQQQIMTAYATSAREFAAQNADFTEAYQFLLNGRTEELQAMGYSGVELARRVQADEMGIVATALQNGANPAETLYRVAKARGFTGPKPKEAPKTAPATPAQAADLQRIAEGQRVAASPVAGAEAAPSSELTLETFLAMDEEEAAALTGKKWQRMWQ